MRKQPQRIAELLESPRTNIPVVTAGWVKTFRNDRFIALNDGSTLENLQLVIDPEKYPEDIRKKITTGAAVYAEGELVPSPGKGQAVEVQVEKLEILGEADAETYPIQPKRHSLEFLREKAHLRGRTTLFGAIMRVRSRLAYAIHTYFQEKGFIYLHTPIITAIDAEGAGQMFQVTTLDLENPPRNEEGKVDYKKDFFGKKANLTVSGQLEAETYAMALGQVYTFGPTFRAENSNTTRHLAEFWMVEPEVAFLDLHGNMDLAEDFVKYIIRDVMKERPKDLEFLEKRLLQEEKNLPQAKRSPMPLREKLQFVLDNRFVRITYTEAIEILRNSKPFKKKKFQYPVEWGLDLQSEHERYLVEKHFKSPVIIYDYPARIKAFYMRLNDDGKTVRAMDVLFPGIGEIIGGSQREERPDVLLKKMEEMGIDPEELWWYVDLRRYGTAYHSGFGLGFERMVQFVTGMGNIRDVIPFPRYPKNAEF
ncbi:MAG: asparagine--tRNA ligase [Chlorobi bacterium]|nr:asparagine--tRNA ligase [Chlorobiota bacterium]